MGRMGMRIASQSRSKAGVLKSVRAKVGLEPGGQGGIRTHGELAPTAVFKTAALNHSATCPWAAAIACGRPAASETLPARPTVRMTRLVPPRPSQAARICARHALRGEIGRAHV